MKQASKALGTINLVEEIETQRELNSLFDRIVADFTRGPASSTPEDLDTLALLLNEVTEQRKLLEKQEKALKEKLKGFFPKGSNVLDLPSFVALLTPSSNSSIDRERLVADSGQDFVDHYMKTTYFDKLTLTRKAR